MAVTATLSTPIVLMSTMCMNTDSDPDLGNITSTFIFVGGIITFFQTTFGTRLPIVQGGSSAFLIPALALLNSERWTCPENIQDLPEADRKRLWKSRMLEVQGGIILAGVFQVILGACGNKYVWINIFCCIVPCSYTI